MVIITAARFRERFLARVNEGPHPGGCWLWTGSKHGDGYGLIIRDGRRYGAHRVAYELFVGPIPQGLAVLHHCDNPPCVNPAHLFVGTLGDNNRDRHRKGRSAVLRGEVRSKKLTGADVRVIRAMRAAGAKLYEIGDAFGMDQSTIGSICRRDTWKHVD